MTRQMKDSGIEWIGDIPSYWQVAKLKHSIKWKSVKGNPDGTVLSLYRDYGVIPKDSRDDNHNVTSLDTSTYKVVDVGDLVINKMKAWQGSMAVSEYSGIVSPAYHVCEITNPEIHPKYFHLLLRNPSYIPEYTRLSTGMRIGQWDLGFDDFKNIPFLIPPYNEQRIIAEYLTKVCTEIDAIIEKTQATIEEYKKLKQSIITEAVTKGIRGDRPMKDSGIEWIGDIPADWEVEKLKYTSEFKQNKYSEVDGDLKYIGLENIVAWNGQHIETDSEYDKEQSLICEKDDILFGKLRPYLAKVYISPNKQCCSGEFAVISIKGQSTKYMWYQLISHGFIFMVDRSTYGTKMPRANAEYIRNMFVAIPSIEEQEEIVAYLDNRCAKMDTLIEKKTALLEEMETYKKSVIYEYVTGKKEVYQSTGAKESIKNEEFM